MKNLLQKFFVLSSLFVILGSLFFSPVNALAAEKNAKINVMTFNLRYLNDSDASPHTWEERRSTVRQVIRKEQADIIGTQEAVYQQVKDVANDLPNYKWIGQGREGGNEGEFMSIFYNENRFTPLEYDHFWLSDTPDVVGSISWGNTIPRMVTWVKFLDTKSNEEFYFVNTHFDHMSEKAREKSAELISERVKEFDQDLPILLTGDFNAGPDSVPHDILLNEGGFVDTFTAAGKTINKELGTFNGYDDPTGGGADNRIDWILSKGNVTIDTSEIVNYRKNGQYPSDHFPVLSEVTF
ncbi:endonuclease/exonuclease/phosphatase family protein [Oceanobacillus rekensis]|uniref:endonuclease/exonuclease/phosphatase family protein n=1 Tax=Oceanobacillus rekensis TaxID=937927 RepID=UPI001FEAB551|nr:endonuclease/exonuclease/phosphatase family protein [Oceanobacillus rekensis]